jgi:hypothetical protein
MKNVPLLKNFSFLIIIFSVVVRLYGFDWGSPFHFHPDERNIASSVSQLSFPDQMNPHFFAYGALPIYSIYTGGMFINVLGHAFFHTSSAPLTHVSFENAIVIGRIYSAIFSILLLGLMIKISYILKNRTASFITLILGGTSVGLIQYSHFATFEMWLSYCSFLLFFLLVKFVRDNKVLHYVLALIVFGILLSIKVSSFPLILIIVLVLAAYFINKQTLKHHYLSFIKTIIMLPLIPLITFSILSPYVFIDFSSFINSMEYESSVALGTTPVFYTQSFINTFPVIFHFARVFPFILNPLITIVCVLSFSYIIYVAIKKRNINAILLISFFLVLFVSQAFLYVKWTRYMIPVIPFLYLMAATFLSDAYSYIKKKNRKIAITIYSFIFSVCIAYSVSFFIEMYMSQDSRVQGVEFAEKNISSNAYILSESYDLGILPFNNRFTNINLFNFYELENNPNGKQELLTHLTNSEYIIVPSQRILRTRLLNPDKFPEGNMFYSGLYNNKGSYEIIYKTPCSIFCKIIYFGDPFFTFEETVNVFDRPQVMIFKKNETN